MMIGVVPAGEHAGSIDIETQVRISRQFAGDGHYGVVGAINTEDEVIGIRRVDYSRRTAGDNQLSIRTFSYKDLSVFVAVGVVMLNEGGTA